MCWWQQESYTGQLEQTPYEKCQPLKPTDTGSWCNQQDTTPKREEEEGEKERGKKVAPLTYSLWANHYGQQDGFVWLALFPGNQADGGIARREKGFCCSVTQLCLTLCDPMDCSTPGFPVLHHLLKFAQIYIHWVGDAIQPSCPLSSPSSPALWADRATMAFLALTENFFCWWFKEPSP